MNAYSSPDIRSLTPTLCHLMGIAPPALSRAQMLNTLLATASRLNLGRINRCLFYTPDALGTALIARHTEMFAPVRELAPLVVPLRSVYPPKTPVCYASMFTGAQPLLHGIRHYRKVRLECDTFFDSLVRAGRSAAIVTIRNSSLDVIFRGRAIEYHSLPDDAAVIARALELMAARRHDFLLVYQSEYDDLLHEGDPEGPACLAAAERHVRAFEVLSSARDRFWSDCTTLTAFCPDHGAHLDAATGRGYHGDDIAEDMELVHYFNLKSRQNT